MIIIHICDMDSGNLLITIGAAVGAYFMAKSQAEKETAALRSEVNALQDDIEMDRDEREAAVYAQDVFNYVKPTEFVGLVADWKGGDKYIYIRWLVKFENRTSQDYQVNVTNCNVTMFGHSQQVYTKTGASFVIEAGQSVYCMVMAVNSVKAYPKNTIKSNVAQKGDVMHQNISCTISYNLTGAYVNTQTPTETKIVTLQGVDQVSVLFYGTLLPTANGLKQLKNGGLIPADGKYMLWNPGDKRTYKIKI